MKPGDLVMLRTFDEIIKDPTVVIQSNMDMDIIGGISVRRNPKGNEDQFVEGYLDPKMFPFLGHTCEVVGFNETEFIMYLKSPQTTDEKYQHCLLDPTCVESSSGYPTLICDKISTDSFRKRSLFFKKKIIPIEDPVKGNL